MPTILNTRPKEQAEFLTRLLAEEGFESVEIPLVELKSIGTGLEEAAKLDSREFSGVFLSSPIGLKALDAALDSAEFRTWMNKPIYLVGRQSAALVEAKGGRVAFYPQQASLAGFVAEFPAWFQGEAESWARNTRKEAGELARRLLSEGVGALDKLPGEQESPLPEAEESAGNPEIARVAALEQFALGLDAGIQRWLHPCSDKTRLEPERFAALGVEVVNVAVYRPQLPEESVTALEKLDDGCDAAIFCSGSAVDHFFEAQPEKAARWAESKPAASLGASTTEALRRHGWRNIEQSAIANAQGLVTAVKKMLKAGDTPSHGARFARALRVIPGGVNSPVRAFQSVGGDPVFIASAKGPYLVDADGRELIDFVLSWGPMILGHAHPAVIDAVREAAGKGLSFGACTEGETEMAETLVGLLPSLQKVRLTCSGTEATMAAIRLARGYTGRDKIIKFKGCYHGHGDSFLVQAGSGAMTFGHPSSPGVTRGAAADTLVADFNDLPSVRALFEKYPDEIAAIIVEPVVGNMGVLIPDPDFLPGLRSLCDGRKTLLIFDEVMTGFRVGLLGAQGRYGVQPDLTTLGKIVGGGMPLAAYGGREDIMDMLSPMGPVYQAGTLSGNPIAVAAGLATLKEISRPGFYTQLESLCERWERDMSEALRACAFPAQVNRVGAMMTVFFHSAPVRDYAAAAASDTQAYGRFFQACLKEGLYMAPSQFEAGFLSISHDDAILSRVAEALRRAVKEM